jgi:hypothetical protein
MSFDESNARRVVRVVALAAARPEPLAPGQHARVDHLGRPRPPRAEQR